MLLLSIKQIGRIFIPVFPGGRSRNGASPPPGTLQAGAGQP